jgi:hypothetical protein
LNDEEKKIKDRLEGKRKEGKDWASPCERKVRIEAGRLGRGQGLRKPRCGWLVDEVIIFVIEAK